MLMIRPGYAAAHVVGEHLHVPGEDDEVDVVLVDPGEEGPLRLLLALRCHWNVLERDAVAIRERAQSV